MDKKRPLPEGPSPQELNKTARLNPTAGSTSALFPSPDRRLYSSRPRFDYYSQFSHQSTAWCIGVVLEAKRVVIGYPENPAKDVRADYPLAEGRPMDGNTLLATLRRVIDEFLSQSFFRNSVFVVYEDLLPISPQAILEVDYYLRDCLRVSPITWLPASVVAAEDTGLVVQLAGCTPSVVVVHEGKLLFHTRQRADDLAGALSATPDPLAESSLSAASIFLTTAEAPPLIIRLLSALARESLALCPIALQILLSERIVITGGPPELGETFVEAFGAELSRLVIASSAILSHSGSYLIRWHPLAFAEVCCGSFIMSAFITS